MILLLIVYFIMPAKLWDLIEDKRRNEMTFFLFYCARQAAIRHKMTCPGLHLEFLILKKLELYIQESMATFHVGFYYEPLSSYCK